MCIRRQINEEGNEQIYAMELDTSSISSVSTFAKNYADNRFGKMDALAYPDDSLAKDRIRYS